MPSGGAVTNVNIATSEQWKDKQTGQPQERTEWHRVVFFNRLGEIAGEYLRKGSKVYVEGSLRTRKWQGQDGQDRYTTEIVASEMQMLDSRGGGGQGQGSYPSQSQGDPGQQANYQQQAAVPAKSPGGRLSPRPLTSVILTTTSRSEPMTPVSGPGGPAPRVVAGARPPDRRGYAPRARPGRAPGPLGPA